MEELEEERSYNKLEWFFYIIFIPLLFTLVLSAIIAQMFGYNVVGVLAKELNKIPVIEKVIPDAAVDRPSSSTGNSRSDKKDSQISDLEIKLAAKEREIADMKRKAQFDEQKMKQLSQQVQMQQETSKAAQNQMNADKQQQIKNLAKIYTSMSAGKAAPILAKMKPEDAAQLLLVMKPDERSAIMAKMDPGTAADLSLLLKDTSASGTNDPKTLQQRLLEVKYNASVRDLASSMASMQPVSAANLIEGIFKNDEKKAVLILSQMDVGARGQILAQLAGDPKRASLATKISQKLVTN
jgi:flagellar motility protein MotE (MotC chaperone)